MAGEIASAFVRIRPNLTGFKSEVESGVTTAFSNVGKLIGGALAATGVFEVGKSIIEATAAHQSEFAVLDKTLQNAGASTKVYGQSIESLLEKEARLKGFSDEDLAQSFIRLVSVTKDSTKAFTDLQSAEDLSRARGIDLATAALAISKAEQGKATSLQRYGIVLPKITAAEDALTQKRQAAIAQGAKFTAYENSIYEAALKVAKAQDQQAEDTEALALIQNRFGGSAATFANTASGQFQRLQQDFHQLEVAIGGEFLGALANAAESVGTFIGNLAHDQGFIQAMSSVVHTLGDSFRTMKTIIDTVGPPLLTVAAAAAKFAQAVGAPAIIAALATYKAIGVAAGVAASAQAFYTKTVASAAAATATAAEAEATQSGIATAAITALTTALAENTAALTTNAEAAAVVQRGYFLLSGEFVTVTETAQAAATANLELASSEVAVGAAGETAAAGGIGAFAKGLGALALGGVGGTVGIATAGIAALAGVFVYLGTRTSAATTAMHKFDSELSTTGQALQSLPAQRLAVAQAELNVETAKAALATSNAKPGTAAYTQLLINERQAVVDLGNAQHDLTTEINQSTAGRTAAAEALNQSIAKTKSGNEALARGSISPFTTSDPQGARKYAENLTKYNQGSLDKFIATLHDQAAAQAAQAPLLSHNIALLAQYSQALNAFPSAKEVRFFLDNNSLKATVTTVENAIKNAGNISPDAWYEPIKKGIQAAIVQTKKDATDGFFNSFVGAWKDAMTKFSQDITSGEAFQATEQAAAKAIGQLKAGIAIDQQSLDDLKQQIALQSETAATTILQAVDSAKQNFNQIGQTIASDISTVLTTPLDIAAAGIQLETDKISLAYDRSSAKLNAQANTLTQQLDQIQEQQTAKQTKYAGANQKIANEQNRLSLRTDTLNLAQLRRSVILPGGKTLSSNTDEALAQLNRFAASAKGASKTAIEQFIAQFQTAALQVEKDKINIATQQTPSQAQKQADVQLKQVQNQIKTAALDAHHQVQTTRLQVENDLIAIQRDIVAQRVRIATKEIADITDAFNRAPSPSALKQVVVKIGEILTKNHVSIDNAGKFLGSAFVHAFQAQLTGLQQQGAATFGLAGQQGGQIPQITRPLQTIAQQALQSAQLQKQYNSTLLQEQKKQTKLQGEIKAELASKAFDNSLQKNPGKQTKTSKQLSKTAG